MCACPMLANNEHVTIHFLSVACKQGNLFMWGHVELNFEAKLPGKEFIMLKLDRQGCTRPWAIVSYYQARLALVVVCVF